MFESFLKQNHSGGYKQGRSNKGKADFHAVAQIAQATGMRIGTVKSRLSRAKEALARKLEENA